MIYPKQRTPDNQMIIPTPKQKLATDLLLSGKAKNLTDAARKAGYAKSSLKQAGKLIPRSQGVQAYLKTLDEKARKKFGMSIQDKVMGTYYEALDATKLYGKNAIEHADTSNRIAAADRLSKFFGWIGDVPVDERKGEYNQFNFFNVNPDEQKKFHSNLKEFLKKSSVKP